MIQSQLVRLSVLLGLGYLSLSAGAALPDGVNDQPLPSLAPMLEKTMPAVVNISTRTLVKNHVSPLQEHPFFKHYFNQPKQQLSKKTQSLGSGVILDAQKGYVLTNFHVISNADEITVILHDGRELKARLIGADSETDIAVIQISASKIQSLPLMDSERLRVGDFVVAIGNPFGLGQTVTSGIISALGRSGLGIEGYEDFIQTDASINPGNSGGALVNLRGELVGINTAIIAPGGGNVGIGFAIPINMVSKIMKQLIEYGEVRRGLLGISAQDLTPALASAFGLKNNRGAVIVEVEKKSTSALAGLKQGDIVLKLNGREIRDSADMRNQVGLLRVDELVTLDLLRDGVAKQISMRTFGPEMLSTHGVDMNPRLEGATFDSIQINTQQGIQGAVVVVKVEPATEAWKSGLRAGDIITGVNQQRVYDINNFSKNMRLSTSRNTLHIQRNNELIYVLLR